MKIDCFAYVSGATDGKGCLALHEMLCMNGKCPFYKTQKQRNYECEKSNLRLKRLGVFKYYKETYDI